MPSDQILYLSSAAQMAAFAFEAYLEPTVGKGDAHLAPTAAKASDSRMKRVSVVNGSAGGTTVQYMDNTIIQELFASAMLVTISSLHPQTHKSSSVRSSYFCFCLNAQVSCMFCAGTA
jgi:hypothetical protein